MIDHDAITKVVSAQGGYGKGVWPNPLALQEKEWERRKSKASDIGDISRKIEMLYEPRFITPPETSEFIAAIVTMTDSRKILEIGTHTGFTTLHILKAILGKSDAHIVTIDARPAHDAEYFQKWPQLSHVSAWTPDALNHQTVVEHSKYDLVFVDSDHSLEHTKSEMDGLLGLTRVGSIYLFHDLAAWQSPENKSPHPARTFIESIPYLSGVVLPTCEQQDCLETFGAGYSPNLNPHLGVFVRKT